MDSRMFKYILVRKDFEILLFESQFRFNTEQQCLRHYDKGVAKGLFAFDRARINQVWSDLILWGLIGRICPVELVRILCAFGCEIKLVSDDEVSPALQKSFWPVTYFIPVIPDEQRFIRHLYHKPVVQNPIEHIPILLELDDRLVLGSFYYTAEADVDSQLPTFCQLMERDMCLPEQSIRRSLFELFVEGYKIAARSEDDVVILAHRDCEQDIIHGFNADQTLFYLGVFDEAA